MLIDCLEIDDFLDKTFEPFILGAGLFHINILLHLFIMKSTFEEIFKRFRQSNFIALLNH